MEIAKKQCKVSKEQNASLLEAALKQQIDVPYGCKNGGCGMCKVKVEGGSYTLGLCSKGALSEPERKDGYVLACRTYPLESTTISLLSGSAE